MLVVFFYALFPSCKAKRTRDCIIQNIQSDEEFNAKLKEYYDRAILNINRTIESELSRLAIKENIDINELKQRVKDLDVQEYSIEAKRIARTESARVQTQAQLKSFRDNGYKFCKWHAEPSACKICKEIAENDNGYGVGVYCAEEVPGLPAHPNCRCVLSAYWVDEKKLSYTAEYLNVTPVKYQPTKKFQ